MRAIVATSPTGIQFTRKQSAALPFRQRNGKLEVMLITSRRTGKWGVPKGGIQAGMTPWASAADEAVEEAGVAGEVFDQQVGEYTYVKRERPQHVRVYLLEVQQVNRTWEEQHERDRKWLIYQDAADMVDAYPLRQLIRKLPELIDDVIGVRNW